MAKLIIAVTTNGHGGWITEECDVFSCPLKTYRYIDISKDTPKRSGKEVFICCTISKAFPPTCTVGSDILTALLQHKPKVRAWFEKAVQMSLKQFCARRYNGGVAA